MPKPVLDENGNQVMIDGFPVFESEDLRWNDISILPDPEIYRSGRYSIIKRWHDLVLEAIGGLQKWFKVFPTAIAFSAKDRVIHFDFDPFRDLPEHDMRVIEIQIKFSDYLDPETSKPMWVNWRTTMSPEISEMSAINIDQMIAQQAVKRIKEFHTEYKSKNEVNSD